MYVGYYTLDEALGLGLKNCVSFSPLLIQNGVGLDVSSSGVNPRTAIAQRSDGAIMMLVIDGARLTAWAPSIRMLWIYSLTMAL